MKIFINQEWKNQGQLEDLVRKCIERTFHDVKIEADFLNLNFDFQKLTTRSNIDEIEIIESLSNLNFVYASYYSINSKAIPTIIDTISFNQIKLKLSENEAKFIENCYINYNEQFVLKFKMPELRIDYDESIIHKLFNIIKNDRFESYIERNMENCFILNKNLNFGNDVLRLLFVSKEIKFSTQIVTSNYPQTSIEEFLNNFQVNLLHVLNESDAIQKLRLNREEKNIELHEENFCEEKLKIFVGRFEQICYIKERISDPTVSHIIIHGESGCGKTR